MFQLNLKISKKIILPMNVMINQLTYSYILTQNTYWWSNSKFWWDSQPFVIPHFNILVFPTRQREPCWNKDRAANTLLKVHDRWFLSLASKKDEFGWYLAFHVPTMSLMVSVENKKRERMQREEGEKRREEREDRDWNEQK